MALALPGRNATQGAPLFGGRGLAAALALVLMLAAPRLLLAQDLKSVEIVGAGIFTSDTEQSQRAANGIEVATSSNIRLAVATTTIPIQQGVEFGISFRLAGTSGATVPIRTTIVFPPPGLMPPGKPAVRQSDIDETRKIGTTGYRGFSLDEPFEKVPGVWIFQVWSGNRKLAEQSFTVVAR